MWIKLSNSCTVNADKITKVWCWYVKDVGKWRVRCEMSSGIGNLDSDFDTKEDAQRLWHGINEVLQSKLQEDGIRTSTGGLKTMLADVRRYISDNRDVLYSIALVAVLDQLLFDGAFRERLKGLVENFLKKAEAKTQGGLT